MILLRYGSHSMSASLQSSTLDTSGLPPVRGMAGLANSLPPPMFLFLAIISLQVGAAASTTLFAALGPSGTVFTRLLFASIMLLAISPLRSLTLTRKTLQALAIFGVSIGLMNYCFYQAIARLPLGVTVGLEFIGPLTVAVFASRGAKEFAYAALGGLGVALLAPWNEASNADPVGFLFALAAGAFWGAYILLGKRAGKHVAGRGGLAVAMVFGALAVAPIGALDALPVLSDPLLLLTAASVAVLSSVLPYSLEYIALRRMSTRSFSILLCCEPAIAAVVGALFLGDRLGVLEYAALVCVSVASLGVAGRSHDA